MDKTYIKLITSIMKLIAAEFGPQCEVVLHDWSNEYDKTIVAIENGHVSGRKIGDGGSNLGLAVMRGTTDGSNQLNYLTQLNDGRILRSSSLYLEDENGEKIGALCINRDITEFIRMQNQLSEITLMPNGKPGENPETREFFTTDVNELLDYLLQESIRQVGKSPAYMNREEKKQVIGHLDKRGALLITRSGPKICKTLGISKFTLYNYLEELHEQEKEKNKQDNSFAK